MICPFCGVVVEQPNKHIEWHRDSGTAIGHPRAIPKNAALACEPPIVCYHCMEPATWDYNEDRCCDYHIYESSGYLT